MPRRTDRRSAWAVALGGTVEEKLDIARDPSSSADDLAAIAPGYQDTEPDRELVTAVLAHPNATAGIVARYATAHDVTIRLLTATHPRCPGTALAVLAADLDGAVRQAARERLGTDQAR